MAKNNMQFGIKFDGVQALINRIGKELPREMRGAVYGGAIRRAGTVMRNAAKKEAARVGDSGLLAESIITKVKVYRTRGKVQGKTVEFTGANAGAAKLWVGASNEVKRRVTRKRTLKSGRVVTYTAKEASAPAKYSHLVEFGTSRSAAKPFMRPALAASSERAQSKLAEGLEKGLARAVAKVKSKGVR